MSDWNYLNKHRATPPLVPPSMATTEQDGFNGAFLIYVNREPMRAIASDEGGWEHVSVSRIESRKPPSWDDMCEIKELFWDAEAWVVQFHPARSEYVNNHPGCLHLWRKIGEEFPHPPSWMVGFKDRIKL
jgi:hypothetical protein